MEIHFFIREKMLTIFDWNFEVFALQKYADPWTGVKNRDDSKQQEVRQKAKKKASRMERDFSQSQSQASQAQRESQAVRDDSSDEGRDMLVEEGPEEVVPEGTVYFSDNFPVFKTFRVFNIEIFKWTTVSLLLNIFKRSTFSKQVF